LVTKMTCLARSKLTADLFEIVGDGGMGSEATRKGAVDLLVILQGDDMTKCSQLWDIDGGD
jgi:hypothetical protein